jgi:hypothetical protein
MRYSVHVADMDAKRPGPDVNHADIFQPYIVDTMFDHTYNLTLRELNHIKWHTGNRQQATIQGMTLSTTVHSMFREYWYRKFTAPGVLPAAFTQPEIKILMNQNVDMI